MTIHQALEVARADFTVTKEPLTAQVTLPHEVQLVEVPGKVATVRNVPGVERDQYQVLGVVGDGYGVVQNEEALWARLEEEHARRRVIEQEIEAHELRLMEDLQRRKEAQERLGFALTRVSPASAYQLAAMALAGSDITLKSRYEDAMRNYRTTFVDYVKQKTGDGPLGAVAISLSSDGSMSIATSRDNELLDISNRPRFVPPELTLAAAMDDLIIDVGVLLLATIIAYAAAFVAFLRYDVR
jgi:hypothetical protein